MKVEDVEKLIDLMEKRGLTEIEIEDKDGKVRLKKEGSSVTAVKPGTRTEQQDTVRSGKREEETPPGFYDVRSPLVGTFFKRSSPEAEPFVKVGDVVEEDTVICIIEAMKIMNEVKAETNGVISEIFIEDGHPVEYMQPILRVEAAERTDLE